MRVNAQIIEDAIVRMLSDEMRELIDERVVEDVIEQFGAEASTTPLEDSDILDHIKQLLIPYRRSLGRLKDRRGISFTPYTKIYDATYNTHWPVLVSVKVGADEEFDLVDLLSRTVEKIARENGRRFSKVISRDYTELMIR